MGNKLSIKLLHCFGSEKSKHVSPETAAEMIKASGIKEIPINTHNIDKVSDWKDLNLGYGKASWNTIGKIIDLSDYTPLWNINLPQSASEAIDRTEKIAKLGGLRPVKFEILDKNLTWSNNQEVVKSVDYLVNSNKFEVWPLIAPDYDTFSLLQDFGCKLIRIMGSPIGSNKGILPEYFDEINKILDSKEFSTMLDGGVNSVETIKQAFDMGFDSVLVNSWIFSNNNDPVEMLKMIRNKVPGIAV